MTDSIMLDHGAGGKMSHRLVSEKILPAFDNALLSRLDDGAVFEVGGRRFAFSTDTYVVSPIFFPGGDIGDLAVNGTVNDLAMCGADPLYLSAGFILEEGFPMADLEKVLASMKAAARRAGVAIVTGDTKVVPRGAADGIFINTAGVGLIPDGADVAGDRVRPGDRVILSGTVGDHGVAVLTKREGLIFDAPVFSDTAPLNHMVKKILAVSPDVRALRDPTRGGLGTALSEIAARSGAGIIVREADIPVRDPVAGLCELLGVDPLYVANEGKLIAFVGPESADDVLSAVREDAHGKEGCIIGEAVADHPGKVFLQTRIGGTRLIDMLTGEQLPRIC